MLFVLGCGQVCPLSASLGHAAVLAGVLEGLSLCVCCVHCVLFLSCCYYIEKGAASQALPVSQQMWGSAAGFCYSGGTWWVLSIPLSHCWKGCCHLWKPPLPPPLLTSLLLPWWCWGWLRSPAAPEGGPQPGWLRGTSV